MDGQGFDRVARMLASGMSRRDAVRALAAGVGATALTAIGLTPAPSNVLSAAKLKLSKSPSVTFDGFNAVVTLQASESARVVVEYGTTKQFGSQVASDRASRSHKVTLSHLSPKTRYYYRVQLQTETTTEKSRTYSFQSPSCPRSTVLCGGACVPKCGARTTLDETTCSCTCKAGYGDCDGDPTNGCETRLNTVENCLGCGIGCDDGNACTVNTCDAQAGCQTTNVDDGTPCGTDGVCANGACVACVPGGTCQADADCCDDELCCEGTCVARVAFLDDVDNCGACGNVCSAATCQTATCVDGSCQAVPAAEQEPCDDGNPCTENDHCMSGTCMGNPVADGTTCDDGGTCHEGACVVCTPGNACSADADCCAGEGCCGGTCIGSASFEDDPANCGACGTVCDNDEEDVCQQATCEAGVCGSAPVADDTPCDDDNPCTEGPVCRAGMCVGTPFADGTPCNTDGICQDGECIASDMVAPAGVGPIFEDDFESGTLSKWSATSGITVQNSVVAAGKYAVRASGSGTKAYARKTISPVQTELYIRMRVHVISQGSNPVHLLRTFKSSSSPLFSVFVDSAGRLATYNNVTGITTTSSTVLTKKSWHELQLRVKVAGTSSLVEVWLNGSKVSALSKTINLGSTGISIAQIGETVTGRTYDIAFDDVAVCVGGLCPSAGTITPPAGGGTSTALGATSGVLLATYAHNSSGGVNWAKVIYRPRQFKSGLVIDDPTRGALRIDDVKTYQNWDVFPTYNYSVHRIETRADWTVLELNRASTLAIVWRGGSTVPTWLSSWTKASDVVVAGKTFPTFRKSFGAGTVTLGAVYNPTDTPGSVTRDTYWVLLAETDGLPSPAPATPSGTTIPTPNTTCPAWVHDQYVATGPDGRIYPTWHPLIDPVYWCYHRHDHGTNPANFSSDKKPVFGYTAAKHGMDEPHAGFKNYVFDSQTGTRWMVTHHFGTAGLARACNRFHTADIAVRSVTTGELLADLHIMGDFGRSVVNTTDVVLTPPTCPDQAAQAAGSTGIRKIPSQADRAVGYEPWRVDLKKTIFGFLGDFTVNNPDGIVICNNSTCDKAVSTGNSGSKRFFTPNRGTRGDLFSLIAGANTGTFYTDPHGTKIVSSTDPSAVRQYIKPGASASVQAVGHCYDVYAWGKMLVCDAIDGRATDREGSIQPPN